MGRWTEGVEDFVLDENKIVQSAPSEEATRKYWKDGDLRQIAFTMLSGDTQGFHVSTVFLVLAHGWKGDHYADNADPIVFESMVFIDNDDEFKEQYNNHAKRYTTWYQAYLGHLEFVQEMRQLYEKHYGRNDLVLVDPTAKSR